MRASALRKEARSRLLQKHAILVARRNHWQIVFDSLIATPSEDRIGDLPEATTQLNNLNGQIATLGRMLGKRTPRTRTAAPGVAPAGRKKPQSIRPSIIIAGRETTVSLEAGFWESFAEIAAQRSVTPSELATIVGVGKGASSLSSAIRLFVLAFYRDQISEWESANH